MNATEQGANSFLAFFWGGLMIGRLMASISLNNNTTRKNKNVKMLFTSLIVFFLIWLVNGIEINSESSTDLLSFNPIPLKELWVYGLFLSLNYFAFISGKGNASRMIVIFSSINLLLILLGMFTTGSFAFWCILGTGLFFSIGWSNIFTLSIKGLGNLTAQGSSLLIMAIVGGAILPYFQSLIIENYNVQLSFFIPAIGMIYLIYFGLNGHKIKEDFKT
jgi:FHS family L-fucose permease-like MFS transporter